MGGKPVRLTTRHRQPDGTRWVEWQQEGAPGWWIGVCEDPVLTAKARSPALLHARMTQIVAEHRGGAADFHGKRRPRVGGNLQSVAGPKPGNTRLRILLDESPGGGTWLGDIYREAAAKPVRDIDDDGEGPPPWFVE